MEHPTASSAGEEKLSPEDYLSPFIQTIMVPEGRIRTIKEYKYILIDEQIARLKVVVEFWRFDKNATTKSKLVLQYKTEYWKTVRFIYGGLSGSEKLIQEQEKTKKITQTQGRI